MRIIKLSTSEPNFATLQTTEHYFTHRLPNEFGSRFRMTKGRIRAGSPEIGELLLFSRQGYIHYAARTASERQINNDEWRDELPYYIEVDRDSILPVNLSLDKLEERIYTETTITKSIVQTQGWPEVDAPEFEARLWQDIISK